MSTTLESIVKEQLDRIEVAVLGKKDVFTFTEFCAYVGIGESYGYRLTSAKKVPHYNPRGKQLYFKRAEIDDWLLQNPVKTSVQIAEEIEKHDRQRHNGRAVKSHSRG